MKENIFKALVVDDSVVYRKIISDILSGLPQLQVSGTAANGKIALSRIKADPPDIVTLDIEMPELDGIGTLQEIKKINPEIGVIMISSASRAGAEITMQALEKGAFEFIAKPEDTNPDLSKQSLEKELALKIRSFIMRREIAMLLKNKKAEKIKVPEIIPETAQSRTPTLPVSRCSAVIIGISTGGPNALAAVIPLLPPDLPAPVLLVQHMPPVFTQALAESLQRKSRIKIIEAGHGEKIRAGTVYIAPGGRQMKIKNEGELGSIEINDDPPENHCRPSVDYLFRSAAAFYKNKAMGIIMTGMGNDGSLGIRLMKREGALTIAQDQQSCVVFGMPAEAIRTGSVDLVLPLDRIAREIIERTR